MKKTVFLKDQSYNEKDTKILGGKILKIDLSLTEGMEKRMREFWKTLIKNPLTKSEKNRMRPSTVTSAIYIVGCRGASQLGGP